MRRGGARARPASREDSFHVAREGVQQQVPGCAVAADEQRFAVVGEFELGPVAWGVRAQQVEGREGGFVVVAEVVQEDRRRAAARDGDDGRGRVVRCEVGGGEVEAALRRGRRERPQADGVVEGARQEGVACRAEGERRDGRGVPFEVAQELVVVRGEVADGVVDFGAGVEDGLRVVREAGEVGAVFFGEERFDLFAFFGVVELERLVVAGREQEFPRVVEVQRCD